MAQIPGGGLVVQAFGGFKQDFAATWIRGCGCADDRLSFV